MPRLRLRGRGRRAWQLAERFAPELERLQLDELFRTIEMPLVEVLAEMEWNGIRIDEAFFARAARTGCGASCETIEQEIYEEAGTEFNINSNPQLREILFERLELPVIKRTKTGPSTDASVLEALAAQGHAPPDAADGVPAAATSCSPPTWRRCRGMVNPETGRLHTSFNQTVAATGRLSSTEPNLQNIPIRTELGAEIRRGFVPAEGNVFVSADYSQIELRILAHYSGDAGLRGGLPRRGSTSTGRRRR